MDFCSAISGFAVLRRTITVQQGLLERRLRERAEQQDQSERCGSDECVLEAPLHCASCGMSLSQELDGLPN